MKKVSIGFSRPKKWKPLAWLIMLAEGTRFSHTFVTWKDEDIERRKVFEAVGSGVRIIGNEMFKKKAYVTDVISFDVSDDTIKWLDQYSHDQAGKPYGYKHILGLFLKRLASFVGINTANPFKDGRYSQICLEAGAYILEEGVGVDLPGDIEDYGLPEYFDIVFYHGDPASPEKIKRINRG